MRSVAHWRFLLPFNSFIMAMAQLFSIGDISVGNSGTDTQQVLDQIEADKQRDAFEKKKADEALKRKLIIGGTATISGILLIAIVYLITQKLKNRE